jgi:hypothetical protein
LLQPTPTQNYTDVCDQRPMSFSFTFVNTNAKSGSLLQNRQTEHTRVLRVETTPILFVRLLAMPKHHHPLVVECEWSEVDFMDMRFAVLRNLIEVLLTYCLNWAASFEHVLARCRRVHELLPATLTEVSMTSSTLRFVAIEAFVSLVVHVALVRDSDLSRFA